MSEGAVSQEISWVGNDVSKEAMCVKLQVDGISGWSLQKWLVELFVRQGGMGLGSHMDIRATAYIGGLEQSHLRRNTAGFSPVCNSINASSCCQASETSGIFFIVPQKLLLQ